MQLILTDIIFEIKFSGYPPIIREMTWPQSVVNTFTVFVPTFTVSGIEHFVFHAVLDPFIVFDVHSLFHIDTFNFCFNHLSDCINGVGDLTLYHINDRVVP